MLAVSMSGAYSRRLQLCQPGSELRTERTELRTELRTERTELRTELRTERTDLRTERTEPRPELRGMLPTAMLSWKNGPAN